VTGALGRVCAPVTGGFTEKVIGTFGGTGENDRMANRVARLEAALHHREPELPDWLAGKDPEAAEQLEPKHLIF
jgi:hypothetical protein